MNEESEKRDNIRYFALLHTVRTGSGAHTGIYLMGTGKYIAEIKWQKRPPPSNAKFKTTRSQTHMPTSLPDVVEINIRATSTYFSSIPKTEAASPAEMLTPAYKTTDILSHKTVTTLTIVKTSNETGLRISPFSGWIKCSSYLKIHNFGTRKLFFVMTIEAHFKHPVTI